MATIDTINSKSNLSCLADELFTELTPEAAAVVEGGKRLTGYSEANKQGYVVANANNFLANMKYNNQMSSVVIKSGVWRFYDLPNYKGGFKDLRPGTYNLKGLKFSNGQTLNDDVSSFKKIG